MVHAADGLGDFARGRERLLHGLAVLVGAVRGEAEPQGQPAHPASEVQGEFARVPHLAVDVVEVAGVLGVRCAGEFRHPVHQRAAVVWCEEPLVRVDNEAVCAFDSGEDVAHGWRGEPRSAVGAIDMQPHPELLADVRHV